MIDANLNLGTECADRFRQAAQGNLQVQRDLAERALIVREKAELAGGFADLAAIEAVWWSRLAAANGEERDAMRLAEALSHMSNCLGRVGLGGAAEDLTVEALSILHALSSAGHYPATKTIGDVIDGVSPVLMSRARALAANAEAAGAQEA